MTRGSGSVRDRLHIFTVAAGVLLLVFVPAYLLTLKGAGSFPRDGTSLVVGRDFLNIWMYGRAAWGDDPARYYDMATYLQALGEQVGPDYPGQLWSYPPVALLVAAPFGLMPYLPALLLWTLLGLAALAAAVRLWTRDWRIIALALASPACLFGLMSGQFACFAAAIVLAMLHWRRSRPLLAGALVGLLTVKPQLALLIPLMLLAARDWRVIAGAALSVMALAGVVALLWSIDIWRAYLTQGIANQSLVLSDPEHLAGPFMPTLFMNVRVMGLSPAAAAAAQSVMTVLAAVLLWWRFARRPEADDLRANALFLACAISATPYMLAYDSLALAAMAVLVAARGMGRRHWPLLIYLLPLLQMAAGLLGVGGPGLLPIMFAMALNFRDLFPQTKKMQLVN